MRRVYLAGPEVFFADAAAVFAARRAACAALGLEALTPLDDQAQGARAIFAANVRLIDRADAVIANVTPFRGPHCDPGTAWEIGYAAARGKPVFAFSTDRRVLAARLGPVDARGRDESGHLAEDFGLLDNLMIAESVEGRVIYATFEEAVGRAAGSVVMKSLWKRS